MKGQNGNEKGQKGKIRRKKDQDETRFEQNGRIRSLEIFVIR